MTIPKGYMPNHRYLELKFQRPGIFKELEDEILSRKASQENAPCKVIVIGGVPCIFNHESGYAQIFISPEEYEEFDCSVWGFCARITFPGLGTITALPPEGHEWIIKPVPTAPVYDEEYFFPEIEDAN